MKFKLVEADEPTTEVTTEEPSETTEIDITQNSYRIEFDIYHFDKNNTDLNSQIVQFEQRLTAFNAVNSVERDEEGYEYTMYRLDDPQFSVSSAKDMADFLQKQFSEFESIVSPIIDSSDNFIKVRMVTFDDPPIRVPGRSFNLLGSLDIKQMFVKLNMN